MARPSKAIETTEWGSFVREQRMKTQITKKHGSGDWPMSMGAFAEWLSQITGTPISASTYTSWEYGYREPSEAVQDTIRAALGTHPLPGSVVPAIASTAVH